MVHFHNLNLSHEPKPFCKYSKRYFSDKCVLLVNQNYSETMNKKAVSLLKHLVIILFWWKSFLTFLFGLAYHLILMIKNEESLAVFQIFEFLRRLKDSRREISLLIMFLRLLLEKFQTTYPQKNFPISVPKSSGFCFSKLTLSDMTLVYRKVDPSDEANYIPVSIFPLASEVFENYI